jgi:hypothetical protein
MITRATLYLWIKRSKQLFAKLANGVVDLDRKRAKVLDQVLAASFE